MTPAFWEYKKNSVIIGIYINKIPKYGAWKKPVYILKTGKQVMHVWGTALIIKGFAQQNIQFLQNIKITYLGKIPHNKLPQFEVCNFKIEIIG